MSGEVVVGIIGAAVSAVLGLMALYESKSVRKRKQTQRTKGGVNLQAGGDINIGSDE